jgi:hypothetical protein
MFSEYTNISILVIVDPGFGFEGRWPCVFIQHIFLYAKEKKQISPW